MIFVSCENSSLLATRKPESFSCSYSLTDTSTSVFFNNEKMAISLFKYHFGLQNMELL